MSHFIVKIHNRKSLTYLLFVSPWEGTHTLHAVQSTCVPNKRRGQSSLQKIWTLENAFMLIAEIICLVDLMHFVAAYLVPDIGNKDLVFSGGR